MIKKLQTLQRIIDVGVVAVVRAENTEVAEKIARACLEGGIPAIEITFTVPQADKVIAALREQFSPEELILGAGTVLDSETARIAILAGAEFIVGPNFDPAAAKLCNRYQIPYMAGCMTPTEALAALEAGADIIKIFPGNLFGPKIVKAFKGPLPQAPLMPTGGVSLDNVREWITSGCVAVGVGSELTAGAKTGNFALVTETAKQFVAKVREARNF
ncbi:MAG TPA: bifunctional 2-keto-4-hydroxyglutarate aldolase/2-keto-3-deoxy-6-phosphogluconate aldolase [Clostridia bacterium]|nr:bifunctional 2-keto-4-hydroxyglutarate aldolase/2-keto-3-deoxy-6-phosphogluconate aldolase [Clostridia bacterium]